MSNPFYVLETRSCSRDFWVFYRDNEDGYLTLRAEYQDLVCGKCGKFDVLSALKRGISPDVAPPWKRDSLVSDDHMLVVSAKTKEVLKSVNRLKAKFFPLPGASEFSIVHPVHILTPPADGKKGPVFQPRGRPCGECGRFKQVTYVRERFSVPRDVVFACLALECPKRPPLTVWIGSQAVVDAIKNAGLTGWSITTAKFKQDD